MLDLLILFVFVVCFAFNFVVVARKLSVVHKHAQLEGGVSMVATILLLLVGLFCPLSYEGFAPKFYDPRTPAHGVWHRIRVHRRKVRMAAYKAYRKVLRRYAFKRAVKFAVVLSAIFAASYAIGLLAIGGVSVAVLFFNKKKIAESMQAESETDPALDYEEQVNACRGVKNRAPLTVGMYNNIVGMLIELAEKGGPAGRDLIRRFCLLRDKDGNEALDKSSNAQTLIEIVQGLAEIIKPKDPLGRNLNGADSWAKHLASIRDFNDDGRFTEDELKTIEEVAAALKHMRSFGCSAELADDQHKGGRLRSIAHILSVVQRLRSGADLLPESDTRQSSDAVKSWAADKKSSASDDQSVGEVNNAVRSIVNNFVLKGFGPAFGKPDLSKGEIGFDINEIVDPTEAQEFGAVDDEVLDQPSAYSTFNYKYAVLPITTETNGRKKIVAAIIPADIARKLAFDPKAMEAKLADKAGRFADLVKDELLTAIEPEDLNISTEKILGKCRERQAKLYTQKGEGDPKVIRIFSFDALEGLNLSSTNSPMKTYVFKHEGYQFHRVSMLLNPFVYDTQAKRVIGTALRKSVILTFTALNNIVVKPLRVVIDGVEADEIHEGMLTAVTAFVDKDCDMSRIHPHASLVGDGFLIAKALKAGMKYMFGGEWRSIPQGTKLQSIAKDKGVVVGYFGKILAVLPDGREFVVEAIENTQGKRKNKSAVIGGAMMRLDSSINGTSHVIDPTNRGTAKRFYDANVDKLTAKLFLVKDDGSREEIGEALLGLQKFFVDLSQDYSPRVDRVSTNYYQANQLAWIFKAFFFLSETLFPRKAEYIEAGNRAAHNVRELSRLFLAIKYAMDDVLKVKRSDKYIKERKEKMAFAGSIELDEREMISVVKQSSVVNKKTGETMDVMKYPVAVRYCLSKGMVDLARVFANLGEEALMTANGLSIASPKGFAAVKKLSTKPVVLEIPGYSRKSITLMLNSWGRVETHEDKKVWVYSREVKDLKRLVESLASFEYGWITDDTHVGFSKIYRFKRAAALQLEAARALYRYTRAAGIAANAPRFDGWAGRFATTRADGCVLPYNVFLKGLRKESIRKQMNLDEDDVKSINFFVKNNRSRRVAAEKILAYLKKHGKDSVVLVRHPLLGYIPGLESKVVISGLTTEDVIYVNEKFAAQLAGDDDGDIIYIIPLAVEHYMNGGKPPVHKKTVEEIAGTENVTDATIDVTFGGQIAQFEGKAQTSEPVPPVVVEEPEEEDEQTVETPKAAVAPEPVKPIVPEKGTPAQPVVDKPAEASVFEQIAAELKKMSGEIEALKRENELLRAKLAATTAAKAEPKSVTAAEFPNRLRAKQYVESVLKIKEIPGDEDRVAFKNIISKYTRVVYGDHGPYVEMSIENLNDIIKEANRTGLTVKVIKKCDLAYYDEVYVANVKFYVQKRDVKNLKNPPAGGDPRFASNNNVVGGYADYKPGMIYVSALDVVGAKAETPKVGKPIIYEKDIFQSKAEALVNPVNLVGVMGAGLAAKFRAKYPDMFNDYRGRFLAGRLTGAYAYKAEDGKTIINFPTKKDWREQSDIELIKKSFRWLLDNYKTLGIGSVCFPKVGCGLGGLKWSEVKPYIEKFASLVDIQVYVVEDENKPEKVKDDRDKAVAFTGHRPERIGGYDENNPKARDVKARLKKAVDYCIAHGKKVFVVGGALGVDMWAGEIVAELKKADPSIKLVIAEPFAGHDAKWKDEHKARYAALKSAADKVVVVNSGGYDAWKMNKCNEYMIDRASTLVAVFDGDQYGGTYNALSYARKRGDVQVINIRI